MKIIVAGAGIGGLQAAKILAAKGHDVTIYEKAEQAELGNNWFEDVDYKLFNDIKIKLPEGSYRAENVSLVPPFTDDNIEIDIPKDQRKWRVNRKKFIEQMISDATEKGAKIIYSTPCRKLIIKGEKIGGLIVGANKEKVYCDLVIDACGINSPLRKSLPEEFGITKEPGEDEYFSVYRGVFDTYPDLPIPKQHKKVFVKFMGQPGFSRVICEPDDKVDVLVGKMGKMSRFEFETLFRQLRIENQIIGYEDLEKGVFAKIPVRYPLTKMMVDGYVAVGDSAFMNMPMMGNGIADSVRAGQMLGEVVAETNSSSARMMWKYQVSYFKQIAYERFLIDAMRRVLLKSKSDEIRFLLEGGFLTKEEIKTVVMGKGIIASFGFIMEKFGIGRKKFKFYTDIIKALMNGKSAMDAARQIPAKYDNSRINAWQKKIEKFYK